MSEVIYDDRDLLFIYGQLGVQLATIADDPKLANEYAWKLRDLTEEIMELGKEES